MAEFTDADRYQVHAALDRVLGLATTPSSYAAYELSHIAGLKRYADAAPLDASVRCPPHSCVGSPEGP